MKMSFRSLTNWFIAWVVFFSATVLGIAPLASPALLASLILSILAFFITNGNKGFYKGSSFLFLIAMAFVSYLLLNSLWSYNIKMGLSKSMLVGFLAFSCVMTSHYFAKMSEAEIWPVARGIVVGLLIGLVWLLVELLSDQFLSKVLLSKTSAYETYEKIGKFDLWRLNRPITALNIVFWPSLMIAMLWPHKKSRIPLALFLCGGGMAVTFLSESESAKFAFVFGGFTFVFATYRPQLVHQLAISLWGVATLLIIPLILIAYQFGLQNNEWLPASAKDRVHIWHYTVLQIPKNPIGGIGIRSSRGELQNSEKANNVAKSQGLQDRPGWHTHNIFLQTWYELGAIGAGFLLVTGLFLLQRIKQYSGRVRPYAYATFAASVSIAAFGYGMWQSWLMVGYVWAVIFYAIAKRYVEHRGNSPNSRINVKSRHA